MAAAAVGLLLRGSVTLSRHRLRHDPHHTGGRHIFFHILAEPAHALGVIGGTQQQHGLHLLRFIGDHLRTAMKRRRGIGHGELVRDGRRIGDCRQAYRRVFRQQLPLLAVTGAVEIHHMVRLIHHRGDGDGVGLPHLIRQRQGGIGSLLEYLPGKGGIPLPILSQHCFFLLIRRPGHPVLPRSLDQQPTGYAGQISDIFK